MENLPLKEFAETYYKLEEKVLKILEIYKIGHHDLDSIEVEEHNGKTLFNIKTSIYYNGCGEENEWLTFDLEEMSNDIDYFKTKYKEKVEKKLAKEKKITIIKKLQKEAEEIAEYERLKLKYGRV